LPPPETVWLPAAAVCSVLSARLPELLGFAAVDAEGPGDFAVAGAGAVFAAEVAATGLSDFEALGVAAVAAAAVVAAPEAACVAPPVTLPPTWEADIAEPSTLLAVLDTGLVLTALGEARKLPCDPRLPAPPSPLVLPNPLKLPPTAPMPPNRPAYAGEARANMAATAALVNVCFLFMSCSSVWPRQLRAFTVDTTWLDGFFHTQKENCGIPWERGFRTPQRRIRGAGSIL
jgi:hypothetical protein